MSKKIIYIDSSGNLNLSRLSPIQQEFVKSTKLHSGIVGGYQSGKSLAGFVKVITKQMQDPGVPIAYYLPTYGLIEDMLIPKAEKLFGDIGVQYKYKKQDSKLITPYGEIWLRSMDNPDRIVSYSVGYSIVDEVDIVHTNKREDAMKRISSRNSFKKSTKNCIDFVSTPEGFAYMYKFFVKRANENKVLYTLDTMDNIDNLGEGYIDGLIEQYGHDPQLLEAYLHGKFVNLTSGNVYKNFNRAVNHSDRTLKDSDVIHIGMDFNITNMNAVIHIIDKVPIAVAEITGAYDTEAMIRLIKEYKNKSIVIYPDASGKNRSTSGRSDIDLLKSAGFVVRNLSKNPFVRDRVNEMNKAFVNIDGKVGYYINSNTCPVYTEALEKQGYRNGEPDKTTGFDHITEAAGYFIYGQTRKRAKVY